MSKVIDVFLTITRDYDFDNMIMSYYPLISKDPDLFIFPLDMILSYVGCV